MKRGEVLWAQLPQPAGTRPVLLLSRDEAYPVRRSVTVAPVTTRKRNLTAEVSLALEEGMPKECVVNLDSIATVEKSTLTQRICQLGHEKMELVCQAIKFSLDL